MNASTMSSAASTSVSDSPAGAVRESGLRPPLQRRAEGLQPWQFFVLAALACATAATYMLRGQGVTVVVLMTVLMAAAAVVGLAALRTVRPLVTSHQDRTPMFGARTRAALEREKMLALRAIKELEFDRAMGKVSDEDFREMSGRLRARASRLLRQLEASAGYRERVELDLMKRLGEKATTAAEPIAAEPTARACANCSTANDADAHFCKACGTKL
jgi:hypothetical protein